MDKILLMFMTLANYVQKSTMETIFHSVYIVRKFECIVKQLSEFSSHTP